MPVDPLSPTAPFAAEAAAAVLAATKAGAAVRDLYDRAAARVYEKADGSEVTDADLASDRIIRAMTAERFPADPILTEEGKDDPARLAHRRCWVVDPIDGTREFVRRTGEFDVLIALVEDGRPVVGAGYQPTTQRLCLATLGGGAWLRDGDDAAFAPVRFAPVSDGAAPILASTIWFGSPENQPLLAKIIGRLGGQQTTPLETGFSPRTFLPDRHCDSMVGYRPGKTADQQGMAWEWDFAMPDLFVHEAGGLVTDMSGRRYVYNKPHPRNGGGLLAAVDPTTHARVLAATRAELGLD